MVLKAVITQIEKEGVKGVDYMLYIHVRIQ